MSVVVTNLSRSEVEKGFGKIKRGSLSEGGQRRDKAAQGLQSSVTKRQTQISAPVERQGTPRLTKMEEQTEEMRSSLRRELNAKCLWII